MAPGLRREYLNALGVQDWVLRTPESFPSNDAAVSIGESATSVLVEAGITERAIDPTGSADTSAASEAATDIKGIGPAPGDDNGAAAPNSFMDTPPPWLLEAPVEDEPFLPLERDGFPETEIPPVPGRPPVDSLDWEALQARVAECTGCDLNRTRTNTVFGVGDRRARLLVIGEAPGADEDRQGEPFVGRAGQLLNAMLGAIGLRRDQVYIANILKCRPPGNRDPHQEETMCCTPFLKRQIALVSPTAILAVGRIAAQNLLDSEQPVGRLRGSAHRYGETGIPLIVSYHPAYLLRSPEQKSAAWQDLQRVSRLLQRP